MGKVILDARTLAIKDGENETNIIMAEFPEINYALIYRPTDCNPWVAAYGLDKENNCWAQGHYYNSAIMAMRHIDGRLRKIPYPRMEEIASKVIDGLIQDDPYEAETYLKEEVEMTLEEAEYFGVTQQLDMEKEAMEDD